MKLFNKLRILYRSIVGYWYKFKYDLYPFNRIPSLEGESSQMDIIVSLTSYGRRIHKTVYYTIVSLLFQLKKPDRIILWLDESWNCENIPDKLKRLLKKGVEIRFCEDIRSYKKLVPTLEQYPEDVIITVDDDVVYSKYLIEKLWNSYLQNPSSIHCTIARYPNISDSILYPYKTWKHVNFPQIINKLLLPIGEGGVLYPPHSLASDTCNSLLFQELCPYADDLWFWFMAYKQGTRHILVDLKTPCYSYDIIYQYLHKGSALNHSNAKEDRNDKQINEIVNKFGINFG